MVGTLGDVITYDIPEVANIIGKSIFTVRRLIRSEKLEAAKFGRDYVLTRDAVKRYLMETLKFPEKNIEKMLPMPNGAGKAARGNAKSR